MGTDMSDNDSDSIAVAVGVAIAEGAGPIQVASGSGTRIPVHKAECIFSFDSPDSETGLYVSLATFLGFGRQYVEQYAMYSGNRLFLHIRREKIPLAPGEQQVDGPKNKITRLAIGVEGGFEPEQSKLKYKLVEHYAVVVLPNFTAVPWPNDNLPDNVKQSVQSIIDADAAMKMLELESLTGTWDGEVRNVSVHAHNLVQLNNGIKIPPSGWKCEKCNLTQNLWLNLTDGSILCGRKFFDGSGGNDHAFNHYLDTAHPLAVKLGTITADGEADVYSYAEDDMVKDPNLQDHLLHWGIDIQTVQKTEKSMLELELEINQRAWEWGTLQESSSQLQPAFGPGLTGLANLGNSCYLNSVMQVVFTIPDFVKRFVNEAPDTFMSFPNDPVNNFNVQMCKLGVGLLSGKYSTPEEDGGQKGIAPLMFKMVIGKGNKVFSTKHQQDALEYYQHLLTVLEQHSRHIFNPSDALKINVEDRIQCSETGGVRYSNRAEYYIPLPVPLAAADNIPQIEAYEAERKRIEAMGQKMPSDSIVRPHIPFSACLNNFIQDESVEQYFSSAVNKNVTAIKRTRLANFPDYLLIQLKKFTIQSSWVPIKLDVEVDMPWEIDLSALRGNGLQEGEVLLPELQVEVPPPHYDENIMAQLREMDFPVEGCKRALFFTKNSGLEAATQWIMDHITDEDFEYPFVPPGTKTSDSEITPDENDIQMIIAMGFTRNQAIKALKATSNNVERAVDWIFSHADELDENTPEAAPQQPAFRDGNSRYKLVGFISHMGTSIHVGHYVCHILHNDRWVIFNDEKVAFSENPPKDLGYLYLYKRL